MSTSRHRIIVLARMEQTGKQPTGRSLQRGGKTLRQQAVTWEPHSLYWIRRERKGDLKKAQAFAKTEGYEVMVYPRGTKTPLAKARARIQELHGG